jgi:hypothetical protein
MSVRGEAVRTVTVKNPDGSTTQYTMLCAQTGANKNNATDGAAVDRDCRFGTEGDDPNPYFPAFTNATVSNVVMALVLGLLLWLFLWPDDEGEGKK